jgi:hypothetical protein
VIDLSGVVGQDRLSGHISAHGDSAMLQHKNIQSAKIGQLKSHILRVISAL